MFKNKAFHLSSALTLVHAMLLLLLLLLAPVVSTTDAGPMGGCRGRQRRGNLYNSTNGHMHIQTQTKKANCKNYFPLSPTRKLCNTQYKMKQLQSFQLMQFVYFVYGLCLISKLCTVCIRCMSNCDSTKNKKETNEMLKNTNTMEQ